MEKKIGFFQDAPNSDSVTRLMFAIGLGWSMLLTTGMAIFAKSSVTELIALFTALSGVFIGLKLFQKSMEAKEETEKVKEE